MTVTTTTYTNSQGQSRDVHGVTLIDSSGAEALVALDGYIDGLETLITSTNTKLDTLHTDIGTTLHADVDGLEALVTLTNTYVDGLETLVTSTNTKLDTLHTDETTLLAKFPASLGAKTSAASLSIVQPSDVSFGSAVTLTRTNDSNAYTANDVIGAATGSTAALTFTLGAGAGEYMITSASIQINDTGIISGETSYILYLYNVTPPSVLGDNVAWDLPSGDRASWLGAVNLGSPADLGSTLFVENNAINKQITLASASLFGYLVTVGAYTPSASRVHVITLHTVKV